MVSTILKKGEDRQLIMEKTIRTAIIWKAFIKKNKSNDTKKAIALLICFGVNRYHENISGITINFDIKQGVLLFLSNLFPSKIVHC